MTTECSLRYLSNLSDGVPSQISSFQDVADISAIEWTIVGDGDAIARQAACLAEALRQLRAVQLIHSLGLLMYREPWNARSALARHQGFWGGLNIDGGDILNNKSSIYIEAEDSSGYFGYSEIYDSDAPVAVKVAKEFDSTFVFLNEQFGGVLVSDVLLPSSNSIGSASLHFAMRLGRLGRAMGLWIYPSFDDRESSIYLLGKPDQVSILHDALRADLI